MKDTKRIFDIVEELSEINLDLDSLNKQLKTKEKENDQKTNKK